MPCGFPDFHVAFHALVIRRDKLVKSRQPFVQISRNSRRHLNVCFFYVKAHLDFCIIITILIPYSLFLIPYSLFFIPYSLFLIPFYTFPSILFRQLRARPLPSPLRSPDSPETDQGLSQGRRA